MHSLRGFAEEEGLVIDCKLSGSLWSGFTARNIKLERRTGVSRFPVVSLTAREVSVRYRRWELFRNFSRMNWLESLEVHNLNVVVERQAERAEEGSPKTDPSSGAVPEPGFSLTWINLLRSYIEITDFDLRMVEGERDVILLGGGTLRSDGIKSGSLKFDRVGIEGAPVARAFKARYIHDESDFSIAISAPEWGIEIPVFSVSGWDQPSFRLAGQLDLGGGALIARGESTSDLSVSMGKQAAIDLGTVPLISAIYPDLKCRLHQVDFRLKGNYLSPETWTLNGRIEARESGWGEMAFSTTSLTLVDDSMALEASLPGGQIDLAIQVPYTRASDLSQLGDIPVTIDGDISASDAEKLLRSLAIDYPLAGSLQGQLRNVLFDPVTSRFLSGEIQCRSESLSWAGSPFHRFSVNATVAGEGALELVGNVSHDSGDSLEFRGNLSQASLDYLGEGSLTLCQDGWLEGILTSRSEGPNFEGEAALQWTGNGNLRDKAHQGSATLVVERIQIESGAPIKGVIRGAYGDGKAKVTELELSNGRVSLSAVASWAERRVQIDSLSLSRGDIQPLSARGIIDIDGRVQLEVSARQLEPMDVAGFFRSDLQVSGHLDGALLVEGPLDELESKADFVFSPRTTEPGGSQPSVLLHADLRGDARVPQTWKIVTDVTVSGLRYGETVLEDLVLKMETRDPGQKNTLFADLEWRQSDSLLDASGRFELEGANAIDDLKTLPWRGETRLSVPDLGRVKRDFPLQLWKEFVMDGDIEATFRELVYSNGVLQSGTGIIQAGALSIEGQVFEKFEVAAKVAEPGIVAGQAAIALDPGARIDGEFAWDMAEGLYRGKIDGLADQGLEGKLGNLLRGKPASQLFPERTKLSWSGQGNLKDGTRKGNLALEADGIHLADGAEPFAIRMSGRYSSDSASFPSLWITSRPLQLQGSIKWENSRLSLDELRGVSGEKTVLSGSASFPLDPSRLSASEWFSQEGALDVDLNLSDLPLETVARGFMPKPPVDARIQSSLRVSGSPVAPVLNLDFDADGIQVTGEQRRDWSVGEIDLNLTGGNGTVSLRGEYRHPEINPVRIEGGMPFFPGEWVSGGRNLMREAVQASIRMEHSSLAFLTSQVPGLETVVGSASLNSEIRGELTRPELRGTGKISLEQLKFEDRNAPDIKEMKTLVRFTDDRIQLEELSAIVAGGTLEARGEAQLQSGEEPVVSLDVSGKDVLVVRTRDLNLRTDANLNLRGPWSRVAIEGDLGITNSRFFKNVELFPSRLPLSGRSRVPDPTESGGFQGGRRNELDIGVKNRPFADWTADIRIHTKTPFLVRGNLARASAHADLRIRGPLSQPVPVGAIELNEAIATLPFSRIDVEVGRVRFDEKTGFDGAVEFKGRAEVENYRVSIYVHGDMLSPKYVLTSVPPLPSEDIITLLATGTVRSELIGGDVTRTAASKAASLFLKNLRKASAEADREPNLFDDLRDRTELEIGRVNPDTGTQTFGGKIRLWRQLFFVGDVDRENDYRALLKYIFSLD